MSILPKPACGELGWAQTSLLALSVFFCGTISAQAASPIDTVCSDRFAVHDGADSLEIPICANVDLSQGANGLTRAIVVIHGSSRNADDYYSYIVDAGALAADADLTTAIIAPQFLIEEDLDAHNLDDSHLFWSSGGWKKGNTSNTASGKARPFNISSFEVINRLLASLDDNQLWPDLTEIVVTGHSAGGQFVNRYAAGGTAETNLTPSLGMYHIVANPSSYLYFDPLRVVVGTADQFTTPDSSGCSEYDDYKYGLQDKNNYMNAQGNNLLRQNYDDRVVAMLLGGDDNDPNSSSLDTSCEADMQGAHRLERGEIYFNYVQNYFGSQLLDRHSFDVISGIGHSGRSMFQSPCGLAHLYDYDPDGTACAGGGGDTGGGGNGNGGDKTKGGGSGGSGGNGGGKGKNK